MTAAAAAPAPAFIIDKIFPTQTVHMISGPSGVGKTTFLLQTLNDWVAGKDVLGHKSFPAPFCYVNCARGLEEIRSTIDQCEFTNLLPDSFMELPYDRTMPDDVSFEATLKMAKLQVPGLRVLVLDAISVLVRGRTNEDSVIAEFMRKLRHACLHDNLTILGTGLHAKDAEGPRRARLAGSVAWGRHASSIIVMEGQEDSEDRTVNIFGKFSPETYVFQFAADGKLVLATDDSVAYGSLDMKLGQPGDEFEVGVAVQWAKDVQVSRSTLEKWLKQRVQDGRIERVRRGLYKVKFSA